MPIFWMDCWGHGCLSVLSCKKLQTLEAYVSALPWGPETSSPSLPVHPFQLLHPNPHAHGVVRSMMLLKMSYFSFYRRRKDGRHVNYLSPEICILRGSGVFSIFFHSSIILPMVNALNHHYDKLFKARVNWRFNWLVGCFGFNGPLRQYFSLYRAVSQREGERKEK